MVDQSTRVCFDPSFSQRDCPPPIFAETLLPRYVETVRSRNPGGSQSQALRKFRSRALAGATTSLKLDQAHGLLRRARLAACLSGACGRGGSPYSSATLQRCRMSAQNGRWKDRMSQSDLDAVDRGIPAVAPRGKSSHETLRWRKPDSNSPSHLNEKLR